MTEKNFENQILTNQISRHILYDRHISGKFSVNPVFIPKICHKVLLKEDLNLLSTKAHSRAKITWIRHFESLQVQMICPESHVR